MQFGADLVQLITVPDGSSIAGIGWQPTRPDRRQGFTVVRVREKEERKFTLVMRVRGFTVVRSLMHYFVHPCMLTVDEIVQSDFLGYSIVSTHEMGHNFGCGHDYYLTPFRYSGWSRQVKPCCCWGWGLKQLFSCFSGDEPITKYTPFPTEWLSQV